MVGGNQIEHSARISSEMEKRHDSGKFERGEKKKGEEKYRLRRVVGKVGEEVEGGGSICLIGGMIG